MGSLVDVNYRFSEEGTDAAKYDRKTWPYLRDLARDHPESGVHFQRTCLSFLPTYLLLKILCELT